MNPCENTSYYAGFDWAKDHHDVIVIDGSGRIVGDFRIEHTSAGWRQWQEKIAAWPGLAVAVETSFGAAVEQLLHSGVKVYPVNPMSAKRYRERQCSSGNKTDRHDAWALADALRLDGHDWRALQAGDPMIAELRILCRDEVALIEERTALINQLQQALHEYYPTALEAFDDWTLPAAWAFVETFPDAQALTKAGRRRWEKFLHARRLARPQTYERRLETFAQAGQWSVAPALVASKSMLAVARCRQLRTLQTELEAYRARIESLFARHPDHNLFGSLPGAGPKLAPRLLGEIGSDRSLYDDPQGLQCLAGTAPVSYQSGQIHKVNMRRGCNKHLALAPCHVSLRRQEPGTVGVGRSILCGASSTRQKPCPVPALPGPTLAENHLENVADLDPLQSRLPPEKPDRPRLVGPPTQPPTGLNSHANKIRKKRLSNR